MDLLIFLIINTTSLPPLVLTGLYQWGENHVHRLTPRARRVEVVMTLDLINMLFRNLATIVFIIYTVLSVHEKGLLNGNSGSSVSVRGSKSLILVDYSESITSI